MKKVMKKFPTAQRELSTKQRKLFPSGKTFNLFDRSRFGPMERKPILFRVRREKSQNLGNPQRFPVLWRLEKLFRSIIPNDNYHRCRSSNQKSRRRSNSFKANKFFSFWTISVRMTKKNRRKRFLAFSIKWKQFTSSRIVRPLASQNRIPSNSFRSTKNFESRLRNFFNIRFVRAPNVFTGHLSFL